jgi:hypothetical protein
MSAAFFVYELTLCCISVSATMAEGEAQAKRLLAKGSDRPLHRF